jgi:hypothetical protein
MIGPLNQEAVAQDMTNGQIDNALVISERRSESPAHRAEQIESSLFVKKLFGPSSMPAAGCCGVWVGGLP